MKHRKALKKRVKAGNGKEAADKRKVDFARAYIANGGNKTRAAIEAGFSPKSAERQGVRLSRNVRVMEIIAEATDKAMKKAEFTSEEAILSMARAVRFDVRKLYAPVLGDDGQPVLDDKKRPMMRMLETWELDDDTALAIQGIEYDEITAGKEVIGRTTKLKACDRNVAREQAHKFFGHYKEDNKQKGADAIIALMSAVGLDAGKFAVKP